MTNKPILFSAPMVRALLAGTKTQTRRYLNAATDDAPAFIDGAAIVAFDENEREYRWPRTHGVGDRLYVREHWRTGGANDHLAPRDLLPEWAHPVEYLADGRDSRTGRFRQGIHMPRWASRLTLTVTNVRVERLQAISEEDAIAEGCPGHRGPNPDFPDEWDPSPVEEYRELWSRINGPGSWDANPWVAAYTFTVQRGNIDQVTAL